MSSHKQTLTFCKSQIVRKFPFASYMALTCHYEFDETVPTMAASPKRGGTVKINPNFMMNKLSNDKQRIFVFLHEYLHLFLQHSGRQVQHQYHHKLWNIATDYCINSYLIELQSNYIEFPTFGLYNSKFKGLSGDQIYHQLLSQIDEENGGGSGMPTKDQIDDWCAKHFPFDEVECESASDIEKAQIKGKIAQGISQEKMFGTGDSDIIKALQDILQPTLHWNQLLEQFFDKQTTQCYASYERHNRRSSQIIFPSYQGMHIELIMGLDTSGSISPKDTASFFGEVSGILNTVDSWNVRLIECDTKASLIGEFCSDNGDTFDTITHKSIRGGGGTDMNPIIDLVNQQDVCENKLLIIFTDGYIPAVTQDCVIPTLFVITKDGEFYCNIGHHQKIQIT